MRVHSEHNAGTAHDGVPYQWKAGEVIEVPDALGNILVAMPDGGFTPEADLPNIEVDPAGTEPKAAPKPTRGRGKSKAITEVDPAGTEPETDGTPDAA